jgi:hypothetical protein
MPRSSADQPKSAGQVNLYWRRRVIALVAGIGMLALVTWTVNGALGGGATRKATDLSQTTGHHSSHGAPSSASATPASTPTPTPTATPSASPSATARTSAKHRGPAKRHPAGRRGRATAAAPGACPRADLVLSLSSARYSYPAHAAPQFGVDVVSTAPGRCTANLGATHLHIVIKAGGKDQVWDSADCARAAARPTTLTRGVPDAVRITWNRKTSAAGCRPPHRAARPGTYTATAYSGKLGSRTVIFVLKGRGVAVP